MLPSIHIVSRFCILRGNCWTLDNSLWRKKCCWLDGWISPRVGGAVQHRWILWTLPAQSSEEAAAGTRQHGAMATTRDNCTPRLWSVIQLADTTPTNTISAFVRHLQDSRFISIVLTGILWAWAYIWWSMIIYLLITNNYKQQISIMYYLLLHFYS